MGTEPVLLGSLDPEFSKLKAVDTVLIKPLWVFAFGTVSTR